MKLVDDEKGFQTIHVIINGDGTFPDKLILEKICEKYNGPDKIILYPRTGIKKQTGLSAINSIKTLISKGFYKFIFIVDGEHIQGDAKREIKTKLDEISVNSEEVIIPLEDAFLMKCSLGLHNFSLYCIIWGPDTCIEQEVVRFLEVKLNRNIHIPEDKNPKKLKIIIRQHANKNELKRLLKESGRRVLEDHFPNICAVLKEVENGFE